MHQLLWNGQGLLTPFPEFSMTCWVNSPSINRLPKYRKKNIRSFSNPGQISIRNKPSKIWCGKNKNTKNCNKRMEKHMQCIHSKRIIHAVKLIMNYLNCAVIKAIAFARMSAIKSVFHKIWVRARKKSMKITIDFNLAQLQTFFPRIFFAIKLLNREPMFLCSYALDLIHIIWCCSFEVHCFGWFSL